MKPASNNPLIIYPKFDVLLDIGSHSSSFSYIDDNNLGADVGDIVSVRLKGRLLNGLVIYREILLKNESEKNIIEGSNYKYSSIEEIVQKKVIKDWWREWMESLAAYYKVSNLKMFKTAFPPGWIGINKKIPQGKRDQIWIETQRGLGSLKDKLTKKEFLLMDALNREGNW